MNKLLNYAFRCVFDGELEVYNKTYTYTYTPKNNKRYNFYRDYGTMSIMNFNVSVEGEDISFGGPCYEGPYFHFDLNTLKLVVKN